MNLAHIHLLLNHFPTIGFAVGLCLYFVALAGKSDELKRASFVIFFVIAVLAIPTYVSGNAAEETLCPPGDTGHVCPPGVSVARIRAHEDTALLAFVLMEITGFMAWIGLWQLRRISKLANWSMVSVLLLSVVTFVLMARAANFGGEIRHPEIQSAEEGTGEGVAKSFGSFVTENAWVWPASEALHFVGLCVLFTVVLVVDLRILGVAKSIPFASLYQLLPLGMLGFGINLITGMFFFIATPGQYTQNITFYWKVVLIVLAGINVLYFMLFDEPWTVETGVDAPARSKIIAASAIVLWVGILFCGHMLPFIGNSF